MVLTRVGPGRWWAAAIALALIAGAPATAFGGAWTMPQGTGQLIETLYGWTGFGPPWGGNPPANQSRFDAQTYVQYGLTDSLTAFGETAFEHYAIGEPTPNTYNGLDYSGLGLRQKLWSTGEWVFSGEATAFIPGAHDSHAPAQEGNTGWAGEARLNAGRNFALSSIPFFGSVPGFLDAEIAFRLRTKGPPDEWHGDVTVGFKFTPKIMLMLQDFTTVSMSTDNRTFPAWRQSVAEASVVYALNDKCRCSSAFFQPYGQSGPTQSMASRSPCGATSERHRLGSRPTPSSNGHAEARVTLTKRPASPKGGSRGRQDNQHAGSSHPTLARLLARHHRQPST